MILGLSGPPLAGQYGVSSLIRSGCLFVSYRHAFIVTGISTPGTGLLERTCACVDTMLLFKQHYSIYNGGVSTFN
jgi:hypothetical protein